MEKMKVRKSIYDVSTIRRKTKVIAGLRSGVSPKKPSLCEDFSSSEIRNRIRPLETSTLNFLKTLNGLEGIEIFELSKEKSKASEGIDQLNLHQSSEENWKIQPHNEMKSIEKLLEEYSGKVKSNECKAIVIGLKKSQLLSKKLNHAQGIGNLDPSVACMLTEMLSKSNLNVHTESGASTSSSLTTLKTQKAKKIVKKIDKDFEQSNNTNQFMRFNVSKICSETAGKSIEPLIGFSNNIQLLPEQDNKPASNKRTDIVEYINNERLNQLKNKFLYDLQTLAQNSLDLKNFEDSDCGPRTLKMFEEKFSQMFTEQNSNSQALVPYKNNEELNMNSRIREIELATNWSSRNRTIGEDFFDFKSSKEKSKCVCSETRGPIYEAAKRYRFQPSDTLALGLSGTFSIGLTFWPKFPQPNKFGNLMCEYSKPVTLMEHLFDESKQIEIQAPESWFYIPRCFNLCNSDFQFRFGKQSEVQKSEKNMNIEKELIKDEKTLWTKRGLSNDAWQKSNQISANSVKQIMLRILEEIEKLQQSKKSNLGSASLFAQTLTRTKLQRNFSVANTCFPFNIERYKPVSSFIENRRLEKEKKTNSELGQLSTVTMYPSKSFIITNAYTKLSRNFDFQNLGNVNPLVVEKFYKGTWYNKLMNNSLKIQDQSFKIFIQPIENCKSKPSSLRLRTSFKFSSDFLDTFEEPETLLGFNTNSKYSPGSLDMDHTNTFQKPDNLKSKENLSQDSENLDIFQECEICKREKDQSRLRANFRSSRDFLETKCFDRFPKYEKPSRLITSFKSSCENLDYLNTFQQFGTWESRKSSSRSKTCFGTTYDFLDTDYFDVFQKLETPIRSKCSFKSSKSILDTQCSNEFQEFGNWKAKETSSRSKNKCKTSGKFPETEYMKRNEKLETLSRSKKIKSDHEILDMELDILKHRKTPSFSSSRDPFDIENFDTFQEFDYWKNKESPTVSNHSLERENWDSFEGTYSWHRKEPSPCSKSSLRSSRDIFHNEYLERFQGFDSDEKNKENSSPLENSCKTSNNNLHTDCLDSYLNLECPILTNSNFKSSSAIVDMEYLNKFHDIGNWKENETSTECWQWKESSSCLKSNFRTSRQFLDTGNSDRYQGIDNCHRESTSSRAKTDLEYSRDLLDTEYLKTLQELETPPQKFNDLKPSEFSDMEHIDTFQNLETAPRKLRSLKSSAFLDTEHIGTFQNLDNWNGKGNSTRMKTGVRYSPKLLNTDSLDRFDKLETLSRSNTNFESSCGVFENKNLDKVQDFDNSKTKKLSSRKKTTYIFSTEFIEREYSDTFQKISEASQTSADIDSSMQDLQRVEVLETRSSRILPLISKSKLSSLKSQSQKVSIMQPLYMPRKDNLTEPTIETQHLQKSTTFCQPAPGDLISLQSGNTKSSNKDVQTYISSRELHAEDNDHLEIAAIEPYRFLAYNIVSTKNSEQLHDFEDFKGKTPTVLVEMTRRKRPISQSVYVAEKFRRIDKMSKFWKPQPIPEEPEDEMLYNHQSNDKYVKHEITKKQNRSVRNAKDLALLKSIIGPPLAPKVISNILLKGILKEVSNNFRIKRFLPKLLRTQLIHPVLKNLFEEQLSRSTQIPRGLNCPLSIVLNCEMLDLIRRIKLGRQRSAITMKENNNNYALSRL